MKASLYRAASAVILITVMMIFAEVFQDKAIIYPVAAALAIGCWVVDKHVWCVTRLQTVWLLTSASLCGILLVRYSQMVPIANIILAFWIAAILLYSTQTSLFPVIATCMLPVMLNIDSWLFPLTVFCISAIIILVQKAMERIGWRHPVVHFTTDCHPTWKIHLWIIILIPVTLMSLIAVYFRWPYLILPPLIVCFCDMIFSQSGFRHRPLQTFLLLLAGAFLGTLGTLAYIYLGIPLWAAAACTFSLLLFVFHKTGKYLAPAGALSLIPFLLPFHTLTAYPLEVAAGSFMFISIAFFLNKRFQ